MLDRVEHHRADVGRRRLQEIAEEVEILFDVAQTSRARHETQNYRQAINQLQILRVATATLFLTVRARLLSHPCANLPCKMPGTLLFTVAPVSASTRLNVPPASEHAREVQLPHPRAAHQIGHAVDDDDRLMPLFVSLQRSEQALGVFAIHHMNDEDQIRRAQISFDLLPLICRQSRAEVVRRKAKLKPMLTINLSLRLFQRGEKT